MIVLWWYKGFQCHPKLGPHDAERSQSLGQLYVWSALFLQFKYMLPRNNSSNTFQIIIIMQINCRNPTRCFSTNSFATFASKFLRECVNLLGLQWLLFYVSGEKVPECRIVWKKNLHWLPERPASLGIIGAQLSAHLKPLNTEVLW